ncbi:acyl CoA:acetate/3-ketoacid CoA transferase [Corticicoccus populi]|uniref:Acyl CoA:acetate/3-ketoacid CoA transferase n=1 Tax=Corticicoccus populi TaxID=1812821 RepID=A0ABW5WXG0_9STAP
MSKVVTTKEVISALKEGDTLSTVGFSMMGASETILKAIEKNFENTGMPRNLTLIHAAGQSDRVGGIERLAKPGLVKKIIGAHWGVAPTWSDLIHNNEVEAYCLPQGQLVHLFKSMASGKPGNFSKVGLGTFIDPRVEGGRINKLSKESEDSLVDIIDIKGEEFLFYNSVPIDVAVIRGTTADEKGNITIEEEGVKLESLAVAQAAKANGGKVFAQVKYLVKTGTLHPKEVTVPGMHVDGIIISENPQEDHRLTSSFAYDPSYAGNLIMPTSSSEPLTLNARKIIGRRAVMELEPGDVVNLGTGIPGDVVGPITDEERMNGELTLSIESGAIGGVPAGGLDFGITKNPEAIIEQGSKFDYYHGSGVDITFMGMAEADKEGNVNVSKFGSRVVGCGGFIDITQFAKQTVFCSTFTSGGLKISVNNGELRIEQEGKFNKFLDNVNQITFSGKFARENNQPVLYVTERAVFELRECGLTLTETAPGIDIQTEILDLMEFKPVVADDLKLMDTRIFMEQPMGIADEFFNKNEEFESDK